MSNPNHTPKPADVKAAHAERQAQREARGVEFFVIEEADARKFTNWHDANQAINADGQIVVKSVNRAEEIQLSNAAAGRTVSAPVSAQPELVPPTNPAPQA